MYYSFIILFLIISSILLDIISEYSISLNLGTQSYSIDYQTYIIINEHYTIICVLINSYIISCYIYFTLLNPAFFLSAVINNNNSYLFTLPSYQDLSIILSSYFIKGPINLLEVLALSFSSHIHYFNTIFIAYLFHAFSLVLYLL